jgi:hypothetical protein
LPLEPQDAEPAINGLLRQAVEVGASDLHLTVGMPPMLRLYGRLLSEPGREDVLRPADTERLVFQMLTEEQKARLVHHGEVDYSYRVPGSARFRVNAYRQRGSYGAAIRVILVQSEHDRPELASALIRRQAMFALAVWSVRCRLYMHAAGIGTVDIRSLVGALDSMRAELGQLIPLPAASTA